MWKLLVQAMVGISGDVFRSTFIRLCQQGPCDAEQALRAAHAAARAVRETHRQSFAPWLWVCPWSGGLNLLNNEKS